MCSVRSTALHDASSFSFSDGSATSKTVPPSRSSSCNSKDRDLDRELPFIFTETLGAWAVKEREHVVPRMYRATGSDSEFGSDEEEEDDT